MAWGVDEGYLINVGAKRDKDRLYRIAKDECAEDKHRLHKVYIVFEARDITDKRHKADQGGIDIPHIEITDAQGAL
jgi:hypothetical protein